MPFSLIRLSNHRYAVYNTVKRHYRSYGTTKKKAIRQLRLLHMLGY